MADPAQSRRHWRDRTGQPPGFAATCRLATGVAKSVRARPRSAPTAIACRALQANAANRSANRVGLERNPAFRPSTHPTKLTEITSKLCAFCEFDATDFSSQCRRCATCGAFAWTTNYVSPEHVGDDAAILAARDALYKRAQQANPQRWSATLETGNPSAPSRSTLNAIRSSKLTPPIFRFNKKPHDLCDNYLDIHRLRDRNRSVRADEVIARR